MDIASNEATELYAEDSVADYVPEPVTVELMTGKQAEAVLLQLTQRQSDRDQQRLCGIVIESRERIRSPGILY